MNKRYAIRTDTAEHWDAWNPTLRPGEPGYDLTNKIIKVGDGATPWRSLPYITEAKG